MTLRKIWQAWRTFWFEPKSPLPIAIFRIFFGILILQSVIVHTLHATSFWYGNHGIMSIDTVKQFFWFNDPCFDLLPLFSYSEQGISLFFTILTVAAVCLTLGLFTRLSAVIVCLFLISMHHHQPYNINGGDSYLRLASIFLAFSSCGAMLSIDRLWQRLMVYPPPSPLCSPWAQRMVQVQLAIVYWQTFCCKIVGPQWLDGTAVYYATRLDDMMRFGPSMLLNNIWMCKLLSWGTLFIEFGMWSLVWLPELRYVFLAGALCLHLGIDMTINLPVFEWAFICSLVTFVYPEDLSRFGGMIRAYIAKLLGPPAVLEYDPTFIPEAHLASIIEALDVFGRLTMTEQEKDFANGNGSAQKRIPNLTLRTKTQATTGYLVLMGLSMRLPFFYIFTPLILLLSPEFLGPSALRWLGRIWAERDARLFATTTVPALEVPSDKVANP
jgi:uncharacterized membrane protein YphA (DoxX/SURF4 family)